MREIKFMGWFINDKVMVTPEELTFSPYIIEADGTVWDYFQEDEPVDISSEIILRQYTELKDKNGKEIYEGDIIKYRDKIGKVYFRSGAFWAYDPTCDDDFLCDWMGRGTEIIGNLYETPELLKPEK